MTNFGSYNETKETRAAISRDSKTEIEVAAKENPMPPPLSQSGPETRAKSGHHSTRDAAYEGE